MDMEFQGHKRHHRRHNRHGDWRRHLQVEADECEDQPEDACHANAACSWCTSAAVKAACRTTDQAKTLPAAVFHCDNLDAEEFTSNATSVDWRTKGAVTPVKNQAQCGSCWAFSTTGSLEGANQIKTGKLVSLSEQQLVDCATAEGNQGCNGGLMDDAFKYIEHDGLETESDYPYTGRDGKCSADKAKEQVKVASFVDVKASSGAAFKAALDKGPVSVAIDAAGIMFQLYHGGIMKGGGLFGCGTSLDHGVLAVGYGSENGSDYWIVKNSWGGSWGEKGYLRMAADYTSTDAGTCGIQLQASYPVV